MDEFESARRQMLEALVQMVEVMSGEMFLGFVVMDDDQDLTFIHLGLDPDLLASVADDLSSASWKASKSL